MEGHVNLKELLESRGFFSCDPGSSNESSDVGSKHGKGVIDGKERVKGVVLEFALSSDDGSFGGESKVGVFGVMPEKELGVRGLFVGEKLCVLVHPGVKRGKAAGQSFSS